MIFYANAITTNFLETFNEFPPRQKPATFSIDQAVERLNQLVASDDMDLQLTSWNDGPTKSAITEFVARVTKEGGPSYVEPAARVAVFDNDGTLWSEKPMPIQLGFTIRRLGELAEEDPSLQTEQPFRAA